MKATFVFCNGDSESYELNEKDVKDLKFAIGSPEKVFETFDSSDNSTRFLFLAHVKDIILSPDSQ